VSANLNIFTQTSAAVNNDNVDSSAMFLQSDTATGQDIAPELMRRQSLENDFKHLPSMFVFRSVKLVIIIERGLNSLGVD